MHFFRLRLIGTILLGITIISATSTYFDVLAHKHAMRKDLAQRTQWLGASLQFEVEQQLRNNPQADWQQILNKIHQHPDQPALAIFDGAGYLLTSVGNMPAMNNTLVKILTRSRTTDRVESAFVRIPVNSNTQKEDTIHRVFNLGGIIHSSPLWHECAFPLHADQRMIGTLVIMSDADFIRIEAINTWKRSFLRIAAMVIAVVVITLLTVNWFLQKPVKRAAEWLRRLRHGESDLGVGSKEFQFLAPIAKEISGLAENISKARLAAELEARLRDDAEHVWTADRLAVHAREQLGKGKLFVVSNREPYMHVRQKKEIECIVPPSGLVTALEPILRACDGTWIAHGSGSEDAQFVDAHDRLRVPPEDKRYTLRRVWLDPEEEAGYYEGFSNEGLWPLCHIAHTRPLFRSSDWTYYQSVNQKFADIVLEEIRDVEHPVIFVQDYHFALLPRLLKQARPDARVAIFWHIPWPNAEAFGICPWQENLLDGLLGADLIGFHLHAHCNNFLSTVDRALEAKTDWENFSIQRNQHISQVRAYPISVAWNDFQPLMSLRPAEPEKRGIQNSVTGKTVSTSNETDEKSPATSFNAEGKRRLSELGIHKGRVLLGVDRMDYTKGIVERLLAFEHLLESHPFYQGNVTFIQIASPSRTKIPGYIKLRHQVEETVERINLRFQAFDWKPIHLIQRQCSHEEVQSFYQIADICVVTSLHDGMNLVAKEYVAARSDGDGVLVLSNFAGASHELHDALLVNPYDTEQVSDMIHRGLQMDRAERELRMKRMRHQVKENNVYRWASKIITDICAVRIQNESLLPVLEHTLPAAKE